MKELNKVLDNGEKIIWEGNPKFVPFVVSGSTASILLGLFMLLLVIPFIFLGAYGVANNILYLNHNIIWVLPHFWLGLIFFVGTPLYLMLVYKHTHYTITDKRVIIQKGLIGRDFQMIDFDQITNAEVNVGVIDKFLGNDSGSIYVLTAGSVQSIRYIMRNLSNPYDVFKTFKKVSHDVRTDIQYPNSHRQGDNPGYDTEYKK